MQKQEQVPTIRQVYQQLKQSHLSLSSLLQQLHVSPLPQHTDLSQHKITLTQVLSKIPQDQKLLQYIWNEKGDKFSEVIKGYQGPYKLLHNVQDHVKELTAEQKKNYCLLAHIDPPIVSQQYNQSDPEKLNKLSSYSVKAQKKYISRFHQKNTISKSYFNSQRLKAEKKLEKPLPSSALVHKYDLLVNICYYDSHNSEKQLEFVCVEDNTLLELVQNFACMIVKLEKQYVDGEYKYPGASKKGIADPITIEIASMQDSKIVQQSSPGGERIQYMVIREFIFYSGNLNSLHQCLGERGTMDSHCNYRYFKMAQTRIGDLRVIFGYPYLYRHLGGCDHIIIFKEARLFMGNTQSAYDPPFKNKYPFMVFESKRKRKKCEACRQYFADVISLADPLKQNKNLFLCTRCFEDLQLDQEGHMKYGDLQIIPYFHD